MSPRYGDGEWQYDPVGRTSTVFATANEGLLVPGGSTAGHSVAWGWYRGMQVGTIRHIGCLLNGSVAANPHPSHTRSLGHVEVEEIAELEEIGISDG